MKLGKYYIFWTRGWAIPVATHLFRIENKGFYSVFTFSYLTIAKTLGDINASS